MPASLYLAASRSGVVYVHRASVARCGTAMTAPVIPYGGER